mmetsp:Transcript_125662/g.222659  ORF Transcript_125662/g.222659 Transcript_125662/m.222659 type:complete len:228 (-) Transcript_125662:34-717(-)
MSFAMHIQAITVACIVCLGHARRIQMTDELLHGTGDSKHHIAQRSVDSGLHRSPLPESFNREQHGQGSVLSPLARLLGISDAAAAWHVALRYRSWARKGQGGDVRSAFAGGHSGLTPNRRLSWPVLEDGDDDDDIMGAFAAQVEKLRGPEEEPQRGAFQGRQEIVLDENGNPKVIPARPPPPPDESNRPDNALKSLLTRPDFAFGVIVTIASFVLFLLIAKADSDAP